MGSVDRSKFIGGSDIAAIIGVSKYKTPFQVWAEKTGELEPEDLDKKGAVIWGKRLESVIAEHFAEQNGATLSQKGRRKVSEWLSAEVDYFIEKGFGERGILEIKTTSAYLGSDWGEEMTDDIPAEYIAQVQFQMALHNLPFAIVAVLIGGQDYREYWVEADSDLQKNLIHAANVFWAKHVLKKDPPDPEDRDLQAILKIYNRGDRDPFLAQESLQNQLSAYHAYTGHARDIDKNIQELKAKIALGFGDCTAALDDGGDEMATLKKQERATVSWEDVCDELCRFSKRAREQRERIIKKHTTTNSFRVLRLNRRREWPKPSPRLFDNI